MTTDQDLDVALALFNDGLERQKADRRAAKAIENAEKAKQQAAAALKRLQDDAGASAEDRTAAEAAYRDAVAAFNALRNGEAPPTIDDTDADASADEDSTDGESPGGAGEASGGADATSDASADVDPAAETASETTETAD